MTTFKQFLLNEIRIPIENILPDKDNMEVAVHSLNKGMVSNDRSPLKLYKSKDHENKYVLGDGHHRLLKAIIDGKDSINCEIDPTPISDSGTIELDPMADGDYYGLDQTLENGWLINRL
jgi:hypothetical protein